jgi:hypothetical protein
MDMNGARRDGAVREGKGRAPKRERAIQKSASNLPHE